MEKKGAPSGVMNHQRPPRWSSVKNRAEGCTACALGRTVERAPTSITAPFARKRRRVWDVDRIALMPSFLGDGLVKVQQNIRDEKPCVGLAAAAGEFLRVE